MSFLFFDIETRVDKSLVRATQFRDERLTDEEAYERMREELRQRGGDFFPLSYHVPISIVFGVAGRDRILSSVEVLKPEELGEEGIVRASWRRLEEFDGTLVSFNGRGFDLPVLEIQALRHGCSAPRYFSERNGLRARWGRHFDLYDFLCNYGATRLRGGFDLLTKVIGLPGKQEVAGADVQGLWESGRRDDIHRYCRKDVIQTYFLFLHVERLRGRLTPEGLRQILDSTIAFRREVEA